VISLDDAFERLRSQIARKKTLKVKHGWMSYSPSAPITILSASLTFYSNLTKVPQARQSIWLQMAYWS
jgi:hypothetical protein